MGYRLNCTGDKSRLNCTVKNNKNLKINIIWKLFDQLVWVKCSANSEKKQKNNLIMFDVYFLLYLICLLSGLVNIRQNAVAQLFLLN